MTFRDIKNVVAPFSSVVALDGFIPRSLRRLLKQVFAVLAFVLLVFASGLFVPASRGLTGFFFLIFACFWVLIALDAFFYSYVFDENAEPYLFWLAHIVLTTPDDDATLGFIRSVTGGHILLRLGLGADTLKDFLSKRTTRVRADVLVFPNAPSLLESYLEALFLGDAEFGRLLLAHGVDQKIFIDGAHFTVRTEKSILNKHRWWSRDYLLSLPSLGRDWAYGQAYTLMHMSDPLRFSRDIEDELHGDAVLQTERALTRDREANILLVGDEGIGKMEIVEGLARRIARHDSARALHDKHIFVLDEEMLASRVKDTRMFDELVLRIFSEAARVGNVIFVIPDLPNFMRIGQGLGADVVELMARFLAGSAIQVIAIADTTTFHEIVETNRELMQHFERVLVFGEDIEEVVRALEWSVLDLERIHGAFFTYPALSEAVTSAKRYFVGEALFDTSQDLLVEVIERIALERRSVVSRDDILALVREKTGVPAGEIRDEEKYRLERLEEHLHERVVGQNEAVSAISDALRRARAGVGDPSRPLGSFLFLGPTGVGKTETAKALSEIFFGPDAPLLRLDMSEYNAPDGLNRLIGGFNTETSGVLSNMLREHQYGVLLLDEFEKTNEHVLDFFLAILDEGIFSDATGRKVSARNHIIVATSNAGSQYIFNAMQSGGQLLAQRDDIVNKIVSDGIFKPELLNRFDGVILFHPLESNHLRDIARVMLLRLTWRLKAKGLSLVINDALLDFLVSRGTDQKFGARPLNRTIQDTVEKIIADGIISGRYKAGGTIEFDAQDFF